MFLQPIHTAYLKEFTLPMTLHSLALLSIVLDVFAILCVCFAILSIYCDLLAIIIYLLCFLMISGTFISAPHQGQGPWPSLSSTLTLATYQPHALQLQLDTLQTLHIAPSTCPTTMPLQCNHSAPCFNPDQPHKLHRYFTDLAVHFMRSEIDDDQERKCYTCCYVDIDTEELWELCLEYLDCAKLFSDFVQVMSP